MSSLKQILKDFEIYLQNYNTSLMQSFHPHFENAFWEMVKNGGKRFRPSLMFSVILAKNKTCIKDSFIIALALESLHTYSLIHDDLPAMDNAALRRNHKTMHLKYYETTAILAGDALNTYAFYLIANSSFSPKIKIKLIKSLGFGGMKMLLGQACDCYFENIKLNKEKLDFIHLNKTAKLIASSLEMGAFIAKLPKKERKQIYEFGILLGIFFQIRDDLLDTMESSKVGKTTNNDINKNSYVNLLGKKKALYAKNKIKEKILKELYNIDKGIARNLKDLLKDYLQKGF